MKKEQLIEKLAKVNEENLNLKKTLAILEEKDHGRQIQILAGSPYLITERKEKRGWHAILTKL